MARRQTVILELGGTTTAAGALTLRTNRLRAGQVLAVQLVTFRSEGTDNVVADVGVERGSTLARIETVTMTTQDKTYNVHWPVWIESDAVLRIDFSSGGNKVATYAWIFGYLQDDG